MLCGNAFFKKKSAIIVDIVGSMYAKEYISYITGSFCHICKKDMM